MQETATSPDPLRRHRLDLDAVENGKWVEIRGDKWRVATWTSSAIAKERAAAMAELGLPIEAEVPSDKVDFVECRIFARAILRECKLADHPETVYTPSLGERIHREPDLRELRNKLLAAASSDFTQDAIARAAVLGN